MKKIALILLCVLIGLFAILGIQNAVASFARKAREAALEKEMFRRFSNTSEMADILSLTGDLGVVLNLKDGKWIAIFYGDSHAPSIWSYALAKDSEGNWFVSRKHFCGLLSAYRNSFKRNNWDTLDSPEELKRISTPEHRWMVQIEKSENLAQAYPFLMELGFEKASPDTLK